MKPNATTPAAETDAGDMASAAGMSDGQAKASTDADVT
jgi:hypothetical protein